MRNNQTLPPTLVPKLLHRFSSSEGYEAQRDLVPALRALRERISQQGVERLVIGVITNSDDRVPDILSSLGLTVSPLRYGIPLEASAPQEKQYDIDFHCMSYDVGVEKPDRRIFNAANTMLSHIVKTRYNETLSEFDLESWQKVYVGDEVAKDVIGAAEAGWNPVLLDVEGKSTEMASLEDTPQQTLGDLFEDHASVRVGSIRNLVTWLTGWGWETE